MYWKLFVSSLMVLPMTLNTLAQPSVGGGLDDFAARAKKWNAVIGLPQFENDTNAIHQSVQQTITTGNARLDRIAAVDPAKATFKNTVRALDDVGYEISPTDHRR